MFIPCNTKSTAKKPRVSCSLLSVAALALRRRCICVHKQTTGAQLCKQLYNFIPERFFMKLRGKVSWASSSGRGMIVSPNSKYTARDHKAWKFLKAQKMVLDVFQSKYNT